MNTIAERLIQICVISSLLLFFGITPSCSQQQKEQVDLPTHTEGGGQATLADESSTPPPPSFSDTDRPTTPKGFDYLKVNFYIGTTKVNFLEDSSDDIIRLIGKDKIIKKIDGPRYGTVNFSDLKIGYWQDHEKARMQSDPVYGAHWKGDLADVELTTSKYFVEGGGRVGDSLSEIMKKYPGGFFNAILARQSGDRNLRYYEYMLMSSNTDRGVGFDFEIDKNDKIVSILIVEADYAI